ncbi:hypothetical protein GNF10_25480 [Nostoc sp. UCD121]|uniref:hypothetical protein n=1 Tax=unclassified Nostoc TaxID=2593658 RepID=UPI001625AF26|nr:MULTISPECIES: hypothetical protein [unclassified Nostoc]MBC1220847.1 hypothetical protein [Nostoc sp. UCD120]MBC1279218.1 hypothetical protein [Nostoc sp. UCD121]
MATMLGFLTVIAAQLLQMTYLHRNSPHSSAELVLTKIQMDVLLAKGETEKEKEGELVSVAGSYEHKSGQGGRLHAAIGIIPSLQFLIPDLEPLMLVDEY